MNEGEIVGFYDQKNMIINKIKKVVKTTISYNVPSIYDVATEGSNVSKGQERSLYRICCVIGSMPHYLL